MTTKKLFERRVRERMTKTGESYAAARTHAARTRDRLTSARADRSGATELASDEKITEATGRSWNAWLSVLDQWGARKRKRGESVAFLMAEHAVPGWWAQTIATGYERVRGLRLKHQQSDGFTIYASKTVSVPIDVLFDAFADDAIREQWLTNGSMSLRGSQRGKVARFEWYEDATRVNVTFDAKGPAKATAFVTHERLPDPDEAEAAKAAWKQRLVDLKTFLNSRAHTA
jgi:uncharacterized protein YndB with AHSA1/START domain